MERGGNHTALLPVEYSSCTLVMISSHPYQFHPSQVPRALHRTAPCPQAALHGAITSSSRLSSTRRTDRGAELQPLRNGRFIEANLPIESAKSASPFRRLMIAQDTGSAIIGPARADLYWGAGDDAGRVAAPIRHPAPFVMLLPREIGMIAAGRDMPLPMPKPKILEIEVKKHNDYGKVGSAKSDEYRRAGTTLGRQARPARWRYPSWY